MEVADDVAERVSDLPVVVRDLSGVQKAYFNLRILAYLVIYDAG